jgi:sodium/potassium-transporting ATPase subunit alpha
VIIIVSLMVLMNIIIVAVWAGYIRSTYPGYMPVNLLIVNIVSVGIAFIPEGLPVAVTASLTIVANDMKKHSILCKSLKTVETLGSVSVLLSDKTVTLTKGQMIATDCLVGFHSIPVDIAKHEVGSEDSNDSPPNTNAKALTYLQVAAAVCNSGEFEPTTKHLPLAERKIIGDATDQAILRLSEKLGSTSKARDSWTTRFDLAFYSKNKFALRFVSASRQDAAEEALGVDEAKTFSNKRDMLLFIKGAPDVLINNCSQFVGPHGEVHPIDDNFKAHTEKIKDKWSSQGKRVLLVARKILKAGSFATSPSDGEFEDDALRFSQSGLTFIALLGIVDPPRDEIPEVVSRLRRAGIRLMMVTGDFKLTAEAIAKSCGIINEADTGRIHTIADLPREPTPPIPGLEPFMEPRDYRASLILSGPEIIGLSEHQWEQITKYQSIVFARTTPDQKLLITRSFRRRGYVVGMTGDGVNDAPSLREADIGICPATASDIAIAASDMVLLDSFASIVVAVERGRTVFDNLKKTVAYLLPAGSFSEFWPVMTSVIFGLPQILSSFLIIVICCFTDCAAATALAYEEPEGDVMLKKPRDLKKDKLVDWRLLVQSYGLVGLIETTTSFAMSFWYLERKGIPFSSLWFSFGDYQTPANHDSDYINHHLAVASAIYFVNLVIMQWFNLMGMRTRRSSLFSHPPISFTKRQGGSWSIEGNLYLFPAILVALVMVFIFCYIPGLQEVAVSYSIPGEYWGLGFVWGICLLSIEEARKMLARRSKGGFWSRMAW